MEINEDDAVAYRYVFACKGGAGMHFVSRSAWFQIGLLLRGYWLRIFYLIGVCLLIGLVVRAIWHVSLDLIVMLSVVVPVLLLIVLSVSAAIALLLHERQFRRGGNLGFGYGGGGGSGPWPWRNGRRPRGGGGGPRGNGGDERGDGGLAGERVPRRPILPTLGARASNTLADDDDYVQPRR
jgi:hypothetical protein